jgi:membrane protein implicated in regulation of membrane protease activity
MNGRTFSLRVSGNPFLQILSLILLGAMLIAAVLLGAVLLTGILAVAGVAAIVISVRVWWYKRKLRNQPPAQDGGAPPGAGRLIEAEYVVVHDPNRSRDDAESRQ